MGVLELGKDNHIQNRLESNFFIWFKQRLGSGSVGSVKKCGSTGLDPRISTENCK